MSTRQDFEKTMLFKKVYGSLIAAAAGDAMGGPVETMHYKKIKELYVRVTEFMDYKCPPGIDPDPVKSPAYSHSTRRGTYTDDTRLRNLLCRAIIKKNGRVTADDVAATWLDEMNPNFFWFSITDSYYKIRLSKTRVREAGRLNIQDNSSAMCISPIGLINAGDPTQAAMDAYDVASLSHDGYSREAACAIAAAVAEAMSPKATVDSIIEASIKCIPDGDASPIPDAIKKAVSIAKETFDVEELTAELYKNILIKWDCRRPSYEEHTEDKGWSPSINPLETIPVALAFVQFTQGDPKEAILAGVNFGRDCDSIATMIGSICGAFRGIDSVPRDWVDIVEKANPLPNEAKVVMTQRELAVGVTCAINNQIEIVKKHIALVDNLINYNTLSDLSTQE